MSGELLPIWAQGNLVLTRSLFKQIEAHALESYPSECCGFVHGPSNEPLKLTHITREENQADKYHNLDPFRFPRTSKTYFKINELRAMRAFEEGVKNGQPIKVIYHSHCDTGAYFSAEDTATFSSGGELMWPCAFIVVSVAKGEIIDRKLWVHIPGKDEFKESLLTIVE